MISKLRGASDRFGEYWCVNCANVSLHKRIQISSQTKSSPDLTRKCQSLMISHLSNLAPRNMRPRSSGTDLRDGMQSRRTLALEFQKYRILTTLCTFCPPILLFSLISMVYMQSLLRRQRFSWQFFFSFSTCSSYEIIKPVRAPSRARQVTN